MAPSPATTSVCNLATHIPPTARMARPSAWAENDRIRAEGSRHLVDAVLAEGGGRYVQESIALLYRDGGRGWLDESAPVDPVANLRSAVTAEANAARVTASGATGVVLRFATFYGPDSGSSLDMIRLARRRVALGAGPDRYVSSITTDDAAAAVVASLVAPAGLYNVGDDEPVTRAGILRRPGRCPRRAAPVHRPRRAGQVRWGHGIGGPALTARLEPGLRRSDGLETRARQCARRMA